ncbi:hypothetical protein [Tropicibacter oceani]|uniref:Transposase DDE domain-containing protein n=1 Tax=Tropicibacter oceani TaxID=3058420 RepID=A0ABY8QJ03_9RHOB|nr:hypothetical protein [Tropicibacter oceani]WGW03948.1 hypothetical protein QF118_18850 [Tropicibacter oceani]
MSKFNWNTSGIPETTLVDYAGAFRSKALHFTILECAATMHLPQHGCVESFFAELARAVDSLQDQPNSPKS